MYKKNIYNFIKKFLHSLISFCKNQYIYILLLVRVFLIDYTLVPSCSMYPTLYTGDFTLTNKIAYRYSKRTLYFFGNYLTNFNKSLVMNKVKKNDIVAFNLPDDNWTIYCKRVVATEGDTVQKINGKLHINGKSLKYEFVKNDLWFDDEGLYIEGYIYKVTALCGFEYFIFRDKPFSEEEDQDDYQDNSPLYTVPEGYIFLQGDNNLHSSDSFDTEFMGFVPEECVISRPFFVISNTNSRKKEGESGMINYITEIPPRIVYGIYKLNLQRFFKNIK